LALEQADRLDQAASDRFRERDSLELSSGLGGYLDTDHAALAISASRIQVPSEMFAICDSRVGPWGFVPSSYYGLDWMFLGVDQKEVQALRHGKGSNFLYCDGHVGFGVASIYLLFICFMRHGKQF